MRPNHYFDENSFASLNDILTVHKNGIYMKHRLIFGKAEEFIKPSPPENKRKLGSFMRMIKNIHFSAADPLVANGGFLDDSLFIRLFWQYNHGKTLGSILAFNENKTYTIYLSKGYSLGSDNSIDPRKKGAYTLCRHDNKTLLSEPRTIRSHKGSSGGGSKIRIELTIRPSAIILTNNQVVISYVNKTWLD